jgi:large subunit ribosomal protein L22
MTENSAKAVGLGLPISTKHSIMVCAALRGKSLDKAKRLLEDATKLRRPIPFTRFNRDTAHKPGMAAGRYPINACATILKLLKSAEANAQFKGLSTANLYVRHVSAQQGPNIPRGGRQRRQAKRTHIEIVLEEVKKQEEKK